ncbi:hypothetical protein FRC07_010049, partial [Ceratobasidium sp. 392]
MPPVTIPSRDFTRDLGANKRRQVLRELIDELIHEREQGEGKGNKSKKEKSANYK